MFWALQHQYEHINLVEQIQLALQLQLFVLLDLTDLPRHMFCICILLSSLYAFM